MSVDGSADRVEQAAARIGTVLDERWSIDALLGIGGMAAVYAASDGTERAAIKVLHPDLARSQRSLDRFKREGEALRAARHAAVPRYVDEGTTADGCPYLAMELLLGETVEARRRRFGGRLAPPEVIEIALVVLDVLEVIHARGLLHRDVKPSNILWLDDGSIRLIDFGIAKAPYTDEEAALTRTGALPGSLSFMSPEHALGVPSELDPRSDVWSLGATMFLLLSGRPVHESPTEVGALALSASRKARSLASVTSDLDPPLVAVVDRALAFDRKKRFATAREMRNALLALAIRPTRRAPSTARHRSLALSAAALLAGGLGLALALDRRADDHDRSPQAVQSASSSVTSPVSGSDPASTAAVHSSLPVETATSAAIPTRPETSGSLPGRVPASRIARRDPEAVDASAPSTSASVTAPTTPQCDPPFAVDPVTGTRRVKPGC